MPDHSLQYERSGKTDAGSDNPGDTSANNPGATTTQSQESNVSRASTGETQQADVTINQDPTIGQEDVDPGRQRITDSAHPSGTDYEDEQAWPFRKLQGEAKRRTGDGSGRREELVAKLRKADEGGAPVDGGEAGHGDAETITTGPADTDTPSADTDSGVVENGGIQKTERGKEHADLLQGLSAARRKQQQEMIRERNERVTQQA